MSIFEISAKLTMAAEGGYGNSSNDLGGETNFGISKRQYPHLNIRTLTQLQALEIYKVDFWNTFRIGEIENQSIANQVFDMFFNMDSAKAAKCVQRAVCRLVKVEIDGVMGSETLKAINLVESIPLLDAIRVERMGHYLQRVVDNKSQSTNLTSWLKRTLT
jgi:lysozyme family protein